jgi:hypothetical protein
MATKKTTKKRAAPKPKVDEMVAHVDTLIKLELKLERERAKLKPMEEEVKKLRDDLIALYGVSKLDGIKTKLGSCSKVERTVYQVEDWDAYFAFARKASNQDLLQRGVSQAAVRDRLADGKTVPGVKPMVIESIRINKSAARKAGK